MSLSSNFIYLPCSGEYLFDPKHDSDGSESSRDRDHLACITELLEPLPEDLVRRGAYGREYYHSDGEIRGFPEHKLRPWPLKAVLEDKYRWEDEQAEQFCSWLLPMLELRPEDRVTAAASAEHCFLTGGQEVEGLGEGGLRQSSKRQREVEGDEVTAKKLKKLKENKESKRKTEKVKEKYKEKKLEMKLLAKKVGTLQEQLTQQRVMIVTLEADNKELHGANSRIERKLEEFQEFSKKLDIAQEVISQQNVKLEVMKGEIEQQKLLTKEKENKGNILKEENANLMKNLDEIRKNFDLEANSLRQEMADVRKEVSDVKINQTANEADPKATNSTTYDMETYTAWLYYNYYNNNSAWPQPDSSCGQVQKQEAITEEVKKDGKEPPLVREELIKEHWVGGSGYEGAFSHKLQVKKFKCKICFDVFDWKHSAQQHTLIHSSQQPVLPAIKYDTN